MSAKAAESTCLGIALACAACHGRAREEPPAPAPSTTVSAADAPAKLPEVYPPPEYTAKGGPLVRRERPSEIDVPKKPLSGSSEGFRFDAKAVLLESKPNGWTLSIYARDVAMGEWFPAVRTPQFHLDIGKVKLEKGVVIRGPLEQNAKLNFQSINPELAIVSYASPASYYVAIDDWQAEAFTGDWKEAGHASVRVYIYVAPHNCIGGGCFAGAQIAGVFEGARVRYFTAPP